MNKKKKKNYIFFYHGNTLSYPYYITFMHIYTSISSIHASLRKFSLNNKWGVICTRFLNVFSKMWLPWQRLVPKLYHLYAHLHINIIHPCKFEEISLKSKWGIIRTRIVQCLVKCGYHGNALSYPSYISFTHIYTSISSIHASLRKFH